MRSPVAVTSLALFAMFFGAGNPIFRPIDTIAPTTPAAPTALAFAPLHQQGLSWVAPVGAATVVGLAVGVVKPKAPLAPKA